MADIDPQRFSADCPSRFLFEEISDKWSMMVLTVLLDERTRFNGLKRQLKGVSQKPLTQCLRKLERNGLITRQMIRASPIGIEYAITPLGRSLHRPFKALYMWMVDHLPDVIDARRHFDSEHEATRPRRAEDISGALPASSRNLTKVDSKRSQSSGR